MSLISTIESMEIELTQGKVALIDDEDFEKISKSSWCFDSSNGYPVSRIKGIRVRLHRFILKPHKGEYVDHINRNKLDNRRKNLRIVDAKANVRNRGLNKNNTSGYKGVTKVKDKWRAQISLDYKFIDLGLYETPQEAAKVYNKHARKLHGEYAVLNQVDL